MKKIIIYSIPCMLLSHILFFTSCSKKDKDTPGNTSFEIKYEISPIDPIHHNWITSVTYTNETGNETTVNDLSAFQNGILKVTVAQKPFNAYISVAMNNTSSQELNYTIVILVNGEVKKTGPVNAPPMSLSIASLQYTVQ